MSSLTWSDIFFEFKIINPINPNINNTNEILTIAVKDEERKLLFEYLSGTLF